MSTRLLREVVAVVHFVAIVVTFTCPVVHVGSIGVARTATVAIVALECDYVQLSSGRESVALYLDDIAVVVSGRDEVSIGLHDAVIGIVDVVAGGDRREEFDDQHYDQKSTNHVHCILR